MGEGEQEGALQAEEACYVHIVKEGTEMFTAIITSPWSDEGL